jgi:hypothetical protein
MDYDPKVASDILDYLFLPNFGLNLQILKVEVSVCVLACVGCLRARARVCVCVCVCRALTSMVVANSPWHHTAECAAGGSVKGGNEHNALEA